MASRSEGDSISDRAPEPESDGGSASILGRMLRLAAVLIVLALGVIALVAADQYTIPFEYEGFD
jgi:hypothetical protein